MTSTAPAAHACGNCEGVDPGTCLTRDALSPAALVDEVAVQMLALTDLDLSDLDLLVIAKARRLAAELLARQARRLADELRTLHPHVYDDAGQRTADGVLRSAALLDLAAEQLDKEATDDRA